EEHRHVVQVRTFLVLFDEPQAALRRGQRPDRRAAGLDGCGEGPLCLQATDDGIAMLANLMAKGRCQRLLARLRDELPLIVERKLHPLLGQLLQQAADVGVHPLPLRTCSKSAARWAWCLRIGPQAVSVAPPSTTMSCRVIWLARSEARNSTVLAISSGVAILRSGMPSLYCSGKPAMVRSRASSLCHMPRCIAVSV